MINFDYFVVIFIAVLIFASPYIKRLFVYMINEFEKADLSKEQAETMLESIQIRQK